MTAGYISLHNPGNDSAELAVAVYDPQAAAMQWPFLAAKGYSTIAGRRPTHDVGHNTMKWIFCILAMTLFSGCSPSPSKQLVGEWKFDLSLSLSKLDSSLANAEEIKGGLHKLEGLYLIIGKDTMTPSIQPKLMVGYKILSQGKNRLVLAYYLRSIDGESGTNVVCEFSNPNSMSLEDGPKDARYKQYFKRKDFI